jgi:hypothetical protein
MHRKHFILKVAQNFVMRLILLSDDDGKWINDSTLQEILACLQVLVPQILPTKAPTSYDSRDWKLNLRVEESEHTCPFILSKPLNFNSYEKQGQDQDEERTNFSRTRLHKMTLIATVTQKLSPKHELQLGNVKNRRIIITDDDFLE